VRGTPLGGTSRTRWRVLIDRLRTELWPLPAAAVTVAIALGVAMPLVDARWLARVPGAVEALLFSGGPEAARSVLQTVAGSLVTVTTLTFSLTVVTLQLASGQYSPRLLRTFSRDRVVHATLAVLLGTFIYALTVLRTVRTGEDDATSAFVPRLSVTMAYLLTVISVLAVVGFLAHLVRQIRVESMMRDVHAESRRTIRATVPRTDTEQSVPPPPDGAGVRLRALRSGFLASVDQKRLLGVADDTRTVIRVERQPGASVIAGTPLGTAWPLDGAEPDEEERRRWEEAVNGAIQVAFERTAAQDVGFGLRQITDVAVRALSPGVNDPTTAVHALSHAAALLCEATAYDWRPCVLRDDSGRPRVILARPGFPSLLELAVGQPRRYGAGEPDVLARLLHLLREVGWVARDDTHRAAVREQLERTRKVAGEQGFDAADRSRLDHDARMVEAALLDRWPAEE
jgi:uncharacterized membrane protein